MAGKENFAAEEWARVVASPMMRRVTLLGVDALVAVQDLVDPGHVMDRASWTPTAPPDDSPGGAKTAASSKSCCDERQSASRPPGG